MKNIIMLYESVMITVEMLGDTMEDFCRKYNCSFKTINITEITEDDIKRADVVMSVRGESPLMFGCLEYAQIEGKKRIFFLDDDLKDMPKNSFRYPKRSKWLIRCISKCEILLTTSQLIADEYRRYLNGKRTAIINTTIDEKEIYDIDEKNKENIKIVYAAGERHIVFFDKYVRPVMDALYDKYGESLDFYFIGLAPDFTGERYARQTHCIPGMPYGQYVEYMKKTRFDIGLAPLESTHFTERKYFNKFLEYAKNGICGIYSNCMPYQLVVEDCKNGYLADNNLTDWYRAICRAIENKEERIACIKSSQTYLRKFHDKEIIYQKLAGDIPELLNYESKISGSHEKIRYKFKQKVFRIIERIYLTIFSFTHYGCRYTMKRISKKINLKGLR